MNIAAMRLIDRYVGSCLCATLTVIRRFRRLCRAWRGWELPQPQKVLFLKLAEQGATVTAWPMLKKAVAEFGAENCYVMVFESNREIVDILPGIRPENVVTISAESPWALLRTSLAARRRVRSEGVDAIVDLEFFSRFSTALAYLTGTDIRVGLRVQPGEGPYRGDLLTHPVVFNPHIHTSQMYRVMYDALHCSADLLPAMDRDIPPIQRDLPQFEPDPAELDALGDKLRSAGWGGDGPLALLNANASDLMPLRRWAGANYVELARRILAAFPAARVCFTGSSAEAADAADLVAQVDDDRCFSLAGQTTLAELLELYCLGDLLVTNDSGPAHFAGLTPIHTIVLFGPETPKLFAPLSPRASVISKHLPCSPCVNAYNGRSTNCTNNLCMQSIAVDDVWAAAKVTLDAVRTDGRKS